jgi:hypothetical protein
MIKKIIIFYWLYKYFLDVLFNNGKNTQKMFKELSDLFDLHMQYDLNNHYGYALYIITCFRDGEASWKGWK